MASESANGIPQGASSRDRISIGKSQKKVTYSSCTYIIIASELGQSSALAYSDGISICERVTKLLSDEQEVKLCFDGLEEIGAPFLNGLLGLIYSKSSETTIKNCLHFRGLTPELIEEIEEIKWWAKNSKLDDEILDSLMSVE